VVELVIMKHKAGGQAGALGLGSVCNINTLPNPKPLILTLTNRGGLTLTGNPEEITSETLTVLNPRK